MNQFTITLIVPMIVVTAGLLEPALVSGESVAAPRESPSATSPSADNTEKNVRDKDNAKLTPLDQSKGSRHGETYVAGFGGVTFGSTTSNMEGRGSALGASIDSPSLADSAVYGLKIGYFHPGRLNWLGLEVEGFNSTPNMPNERPLDQKPVSFFHTVSCYKTKR